MFVGRENELETLERAYDADVFQMVVVYGRRRVGKTTLLTHFAQDKPTLFFTAQQQTDADAETAEMKSASNNVRPSKEEVLAMREKTLDGMPETEISRLRENIKVANLQMLSLIHI